jgi:hypothetical protein
MSKTYADSCALVTSRDIVAPLVWHLWGGLTRTRLRFAAAFCLLAGIQAVAQTGIFVVPPQYAVGISPLAVAVGDFNGDGKPDLAVSSCPVSGCGSNPPSTVSILLGNGDGTFRPHVDYQVGTPGGLAVGDFDGDGKPDLAVANGGSVAVLLGNGDGTLQAAVDYGTAGSSASVAVGDFNGDGKPDLVVTNSVDNSVSIFLNSGNGTFLPRKDYDTGSYPDSVTVGDFNGDNKLDLAVVGSAASILLGNGDGTFQTHLDYSVGAAAVSIVAADLNGDGALDLAVVNSNSSLNQPNPGSVSVLLGNGNGTFQPQQVYPAGLMPSSVVVEDFNGDGQPDFAVTNEADQTVGVYINQGQGGFSQPMIFYGAGGAAVAAVAKDFNGDQKLDIAVVCDNGNVGGVCLLLGKGDGSFSPTNLSYPTGNNPDAVAMADLNGDSKNDLAVANFNDNDVSVFVANGDGTLQPPANYGTGNGPSSVAVGDLNGDAKPDLVTTNEIDNTVSVLLNSGNGTFQTHVDYPTPGGPVSVAVGDFNGDGKLDLAVVCSDNVRLLFGNGDGTFPGHIDYGGGGTSVVTGDFNGDGMLDFAVVDGSGAVVWLNAGDGTFTARGVNLGGGNSSSLHSNASFTPAMTFNVFTTIMAGDFNGDGKLDMVVVGPPYVVNYNPLEVLLGNGDGTFRAPIVAESEGNSIAVGDFNNDGILDVAVGVDYFVGEFLGVELFLGNGDGTLRFAGPYPTGIASLGGVVVAGDLNGDGKPDLAVANGGVFSVDNSNTLTILLNAGQVTPSFKLAVSPGSQTVNAGNSTTFTVTATTTNGFTGTVAITCPLPFAGTCTASPASIVPTTSGASSTVTVTSSASATPGTYSLTVTGTSGSEKLGVHPSLTVKPGPPDFSISAPSSTTPSSVMPGQAGIAKVTVGSTGGFTGTVTFTCKVLPASSLAPACSLSPTQVILTSGGKTTSILTVNTTAPVALLARPHLGRGLVPVYAMVFPILGATLLGVGFTPNGRRKGLVGLMMCCLLIGGLAFQMACGGGSGSSTGAPGTPAGSYTITVAGSSGTTKSATSLVLAVQ